MQNDTSPVVDMFRALYTYKALPGQHAALEALLVEACHAVRNDRGMMGLTLARSTEFVGGFIVFSRWEDRVTLSECFMEHRDSGLVGRISDLCEVFSLDVFVPHDPAGAVHPAPGREGGAIASRLFLPRPEHVAQARLMLEDRAALACTAQGCLWVRAHVHADRADCFHLLTGWDSRASLDRALKDYTLPFDWLDPRDKVKAVALDILETVLEIVPDRLMQGEQVRP